MACFSTHPPASSDSNKKRKADESLVLSDNEKNQDSFPSFLVVESVDGQPIKLSIFGIQKLLKCAVGDVKSAMKLRGGAVLVEVTSKKEAERALNMTTWVDVAVKVTPHRSL